MQLQWTLIVVNKWFPSEEKRVEGRRILVLRRAHRWPQQCGDQLVAGVNVALGAVDFSTTQGIPDTKPRARRALGRPAVSVGFGRGEQRYWLRHRRSAA
jgi:hypothetical protein